MSIDELLELVNVEGTHDLRGVSDVTGSLRRIDTYVVERA